MLVIFYLFASITGFLAVKKCAVRATATHEAARTGRHDAVSASVSGVFDMRNLHVGRCRYDIDRVHRTFSKLDLSPAAFQIN